MDFLLTLLSKVTNHHSPKIVFAFYAPTCLTVKKKRSENIFNERHKVFCKKSRNKSPSLGKTHTFITIYNNKENISYKFALTGTRCFTRLQQLVEFRQ